MGNTHLVADCLEAIDEMSYVPRDMIYSLRRLKEQIRISQTFNEVLQFVRFVGKCTNDLSNHGCLYLSNDLGVICFSRLDALVRR